MSSIFKRCCEPGNKSDHRHEPYDRLPAFVQRIIAEVNKISNNGAKPRLERKQQGIVTRIFLCVVAILLSISPSAATAQVASDTANQVKPKQPKVQRARPVRRRERKSPGGDLLNLYGRSELIRIREQLQREILLLESMISSAFSDYQAALAMARPFRNLQFPTDSPCPPEPIIELSEASPRYGEMSSNIVRSAALIQSLQFQRATNVTRVLEINAALMAQSKPEAPPHIPGNEVGGNKPSEVALKSLFQEPTERKFRKNDHK